MELQKIEQESQALIVTANKFNIVSNEVYVEAMEFAKNIKGLIKEVEASFDPIVKKSYAAWKEAIAQKDKHLEPLNGALKLIDGKGRTFRYEQEQIRLEEERKARELAQKEADRLARRAEKAAESGKVEKAAELQEKAAELAAITPIIQTKVSKVEGIVVRKVWKAEVTDFGAYVKAVANGQLPLISVQANETYLKQQAISTKGTMIIPGVRIYSEDSKL